MSAVSQDQLTDFTIRNVYIGLDADTRFVRRTAEMIVTPYWSGKSNPSEVACLESQLKKTGLFKIVKTEVLKTEVEGEFNLDLNLNYRDRHLNYRISEIRLHSFPDADQRVFRRQIMRKPTIQLMRGFPDFETEVKRAIATALGKTIGGSSEIKFWIYLKRVAPGRLDVDVFPEFPAERCQEVKIY